MKIRRYITLFNTCNTCKTMIMAVFLIIGMLLLSACGDSASDASTEENGGAEVELLAAALGNSMDSVASSSESGMNETFCTATDEDENGNFWGKVISDESLLERKDDISVLTVAFNIKNTGKTPLVIGVSESLYEDIKISVNNAEPEFSIFCIYTYRGDEEWLFDKKEITADSGEVECRVSMMIPREVRENEDKEITLTLYGKSFNIKEFIYNNLTEDEKTEMEIERKARELGLTDVDVKYVKMGDSTLVCSNYNELNEKEMLTVIEELESFPGVLSISYVHVGEDRYTISTYSKKIELNGEVIYDDYYSSDAYKDEQEEDWEDEGNNSVDSSDSSNNYDTSEPEEFKAVSDDHEKSICWTAATSIVKSNLKAPSTAEFPFSYNSEGVSISYSGKTYKITGWVDAENSFGVQLRNYFTVVLEKVSGSGRDAQFKEVSCTFSN